jgi:hypothetical protein
MLFLRFLASLFALALLASCAMGPTYNPTVFPFELEEERVAEMSIKRVVIPHVNLGPPSRNYLEAVEPRIDARLAQYLKANGYRVIPQKDFREHWSTAVRAFGDPVDPTTGKVNMSSFSQIMMSVRDRLVEEHDLDAFVFTDLVELEVPFAGGLNHLARWDGVSRKPTLQGGGQGVSTAFDWNKPASVASLQVAIFDRELQRVFFSRGGLDATDAIDTRSSDGNYVRRRAILENNTHIDEGIALALHPLIVMEDWPGNP